MAHPEEGSQLDKAIGRERSIPPIQIERALEVYLEEKATLDYLAALFALPFDQENGQEVKNRVLAVNRHPQYENWLEQIERYIISNYAKEYGIKPGQQIPEELKYQIFHDASIQLSKIELMFRSPDLDSDIKKQLREQLQQCYTDVLNWLLKVLPPNLAKDPQVIEKAHELTLNQFGQLSVDFKYAGDMEWFETMELYCSGQFRAGDILRHVLTLPAIAKLHSMRGQLRRFVDENSR